MPFAHWSGCRKPTRGQRGCRAGFDSMPPLTHHSRMKPHKPSFLAELYRKVGEGLGLLDLQDGRADESGLRGLPPDEARRVARELTRTVRSITRKNNLFASREEILRLVKAGRR